MLNDIRLFGRKREIAERILQTEFNALALLCFIPPRGKNILLRCLLEITAEGLDTVRCAPQEAIFEQVTSVIVAVTLVKAESINQELVHVFFWSIVKVGFLLDSGKDNCGIVRVPGKDRLYSWSSRGLGRRGAFQPMGRPVFLLAVWTTVSGSLALSTHFQMHVCLLAMVAKECRCHAVRNGVA